MVIGVVGGPGCPPDIGNGSARQLAAAIIIIGQYVTYGIAVDLGDRLVGVGEPAQAIDSDAVEVEGRVAGRAVSAGGIAG